VGTSTHVRAVALASSAASAAPSMCAIPYVLGHYHAMESRDRDGRTPPHLQPLTCMATRDENGRQTLNSLSFSYFLSETKSKTVTPEMETISVFRKHRKQKFDTENTPITVEI
jgi:hypothetical protein